MATEAEHLHWHKIGFACKREHLSGYAWGLNKTVLAQTKDGAQAKLYCVKI